MDFMEHTRLEVAITKAKDRIISMARELAERPGSDRMLQSAIAALDHAIADMRAAQKEGAQ